MGGLARKSTVLSDYVNENIYVVDAGNLFFSKELVDKGISTDAADVNANIILDSFNKMGCDIFSPGSKDFALGKNFLVDFSKKSKFLSYLQIYMMIMINCFLNPMLSMKSLVTR